MQVSGEHGLQAAVDVLERDLLVGWQRKALCIVSGGVDRISVLWQYFSVAHQHPNVSRAGSRLFVKSALSGGLSCSMYRLTKMR
jgi:hypothetical protein